MHYSYGMNNNTATTIHHLASIPNDRVHDAWLQSQMSAYDPDSVATSADILAFDFFDDRDRFGYAVHFTGSSRLLVSLPGFVGSADFDGVAGDMADFERAIVSILNDDEAAW